MERIKRKQKVKVVNVQYESSLTCKLRICKSGFAYGEYFVVVKFRIAIAFVQHFMSFSILKLFFLLFLIIPVQNI